MFKNSSSGHNVSNYSRVSSEPSLISMNSVNKTFSIHKNRSLAFGLVFLTFISAVLIFYSEPDVIDEENRVMKDLGELHLKEQHTNLLFHLLTDETSDVLKRVNNAISAIPPNISIDPDVKLIFTNISKAAASYFRMNNTLKPPSLFNFVPHLLSDPFSLRPISHFTKYRNGVSAVIGLPTVKRQAQSYLIATLSDLIDKMSSRDKEDTLIVIFIAEINQNFIAEIVNEIKSQFEEVLETGLIDIISPPASYYPDFEKLRLTLSDPLERVHWRSKQCLDFAFLMMYCYPKGMFYVQLEDDILAKKNYLSVMKNTALMLTARNQPWFVLDFCQLGFIGKMFRSADLPSLIQFIFMFYNDKPVDWLLDNLIQTKVCNLEKDSKDCKLQKDKLWVHNKPSLFQHIGTTSSLKGKVQKLKDKHFGKIPLFYPHANPPAAVRSSIKPFKKYTLERAYNGETFFWGSEPQSGDWVSFIFEKPIKLKRFRFRSGNFENPSDRFSNTSVLAHFVQQNVVDSSVTLQKVLQKKKTSTEDSLSVVGKFNGVGIAEELFNITVSPVKELKLVLHNATKNWVILSEILIEEHKIKR